MPKALKSCPKSKNCPIWSHWERTTVHLTNRNFENWNQNSAQSYFFKVMKRQANISWFQSNSNPVDNLINAQRSKIVTQAARQFPKLLWCALASLFTIITCLENLAKLIICTVWTITNGLSSFYAEIRCKKSVCPK